MAKDDLAKRRAEAFLRDVATEPFVALVFPASEADRIKVYVSGMTPEKLHRIEAFVEQVMAE